ncbi:Heparan-sulfate 6-O-sulfotransferase 2 [Eumeta japonica]|uniref:Heparan-sulfate 6-O-sulfotransferase n=1 Tax=Eumeta variegata TaxID=151549 RepID=A0A4C1ZR23_EUMVA|nr:Heparan-sulfate 6-O-sulfotransferase 2 [Eumeta japonica]
MPLPLSDFVKLIPLQPGAYSDSNKNRSSITGRRPLAAAVSAPPGSRISQYVFEETFNLRFAVPFTQHNATVSGATLAAMSPAQVARVRTLNSLDLELYQFAKHLMFKRFEALKNRDSDFEYRWRHLGEVSPRSGVTEFDWDSNLEDATTERYRGK